MMDEAMDTNPTPGSAKKRHHRRAKKKKGPKDVHQSENVVEEEATSSPTKASKLSIQSQKTSQRSDGGALRRRCRKKQIRSNGTKRPLVLRPTDGPLLHAPKNSTQYIMEDHGDNTGDYIRDSESDAGAIAPGELAAGGARGDNEPNQAILSPDDDTYWAEFSERDFQTVYESAHREEVAEWDRGKLINEISHLEKRQKELINLLSRLDPDVYLRRLQTRATTIMEKNRLLKMQIKLTSSAPNSDGEGSGSSSGLK